MSKSLLVLKLNETENQIVLLLPDSKKAEELFVELNIIRPGEQLILLGEFTPEAEENRITVEADDNLLPQLVTEVLEGALAIENSEGNYFKRVVPTQDIKITIIVKDLKEITLVRPARVEMKNPRRKRTGYLSAKISIPTIFWVTPQAAGYETPDGIKLRQTKKQH